MRGHRLMCQARISIHNCVLVILLYQMHVQYLDWASTNFCSLHWKRSEFLFVSNVKWINFNDVLFTKSPMLLVAIGLPLISLWCCASIQFLCRYMLCLFVAAFHQSLLSWIHSKFPLKMLNFVSPCLLSSHDITWHKELGFFHLSGWVDAVTGQCVWEYFEKSRHVKIATTSNKLLWAWENFSIRYLQTSNKFCPLGGLEETDVSCSCGLESIWIFCKSRVFLVVIA